MFGTAARYPILSVQINRPTRKRKKATKATKKYKTAGGTERKGTGSQDRKQI
jgi:hypothetical protein